MTAYEECNMMKAMLQRLGFSCEAARAICDREGIQSLSELRALQDADLNALYAKISDIFIPFCAQERLKLACYFLRHKLRTSRPVTFKDIDLREIESMAEFRTIEMERPKTKQITPNKNMIDTSDWLKTMDCIEDFLRRHRGVTGVPLSYVVRKDMAVPDYDDGYPHENFPTMDMEMIARAPIRNDTDDGFVTSYLADREQVWNIISDITYDKPDCWEYVKPAQATADGRAAYWNLVHRYLGSHRVEQLANASEEFICRTKYTGPLEEKRFEAFVQSHIRHHNVLESLVKYGYENFMRENYKIDYLLEAVEHCKEFAYVVPAVKMDLKLGKEMMTLVDVAERLLYFVRNHCECEVNNEKEQAIQRVNKKQKHK